MLFFKGRSKALQEHRKNCFCLVPSERGSCELGQQDWEEALSGIFLELQGKGWGRQELASLPVVRSSASTQNLCSSQFPSAPQPPLPQAGTTSLVCQEITLLSKRPSCFQSPSLFHPFSMQASHTNFCSDQGDQVTSPAETYPLPWLLGEREDPMSWPHDLLISFPLQSHFWPLVRLNLGASAHLRTCMFGRL